MRRSISRTYSRRRPKHVGSFIQSIPNELLTEIFSRVGSESFIDIFNLRLSCKMFKKLTEDKHIYQNISLDKIPLFEWKPANEKQRAFLAKCQNSRNHELIFRQAMLDYNYGRGIQSALKNLEKSANSGYLTAFYATCIILLLSGDDESMRSGAKALGSMKKSKFWRKKLIDCRSKLADIMKYIWVENLDLKRRRSVCCKQDGDGHRRRNGWPEFDDEDKIKCEGCLVDQEIGLLDRAAIRYPC